MSPVADARRQEQTLLRGPCRHVLAAQVAGLHVLRIRTKHGGVLEVVGHFVSMTCPHCGRVWRHPEAPVPPAA